MTLAGKKLQDIYDSGAKTLIGLQEHATKNFEEVGEEHAQSMKQLTEKSSLSLQDQSGNLQTELKDLMRGSLERLQNALLAEREQNQTFVISLIAELQTRTEQMKSKLAALGQSHHENVDFAFNVACQHYLSNLETAKISLDASATETATGLDGYGATVSDKLLRTMEQALWQQHEQSQELSGSFFTSAREQEEVVNNHASRLGQTFTNSSQNRLAEAKTLANKATDEVESSIHSLLETVGRHVSSMESESNEKYVRLTENHFQKVDVRLSEFADELSNLHDGVTDQLLKETEELSTDLLSASTQAQDKLRVKCDHAVTSVDSDFTAFKQRLDVRLQLSRGQKQTLEDDKNKILIAIKNELLSIHDLFAKKVATLLGEAKSDIAGMTQSVEAKIMTAMETCDEQVSTSAVTVQKQIEDEVAAFLQELSNTRAAAVEEISSSAQGNLSLVNVPQNAENDDEMAESQSDTEPTENKLTSSSAGDGKTTKKNRRRKNEDMTDKEDEDDK